MVSIPTEVADIFDPDPLPDVIVVTDRRLSYRPLPCQVGAAANPHVGILFRDKDMEPTARRSLCLAVAAAARASGSSFVIAVSPTETDLELVRLSRADGAHVSATSHLPNAPVRWLGRSCHDERELGRARLEGVDYVLLGPVFDSISKPGLAGFGSQRLAELTGRQEDRPKIYALGGLTPERVGAAMAAGTWGVAVCGSVMMAVDPKEVVKRLVHEVRDARGRPLRRTPSGDVTRGSEG